MVENPYHTCCVTGHRDLPPGAVPFVTEALELAVEQAVLEGFTCFLSGFAEGVDLLFAEIVAQRRSAYPHIRLEAILPCRARYQKLLLYDNTHTLLDACQDVYFISEDYTKGVYLKRDRYMVDRSSQVIAVYDGRETGGTAYTVRYAGGKGKPVSIIVPKAWDKRTG